VGIGRLGIGNVGVVTDPMERWKIHAKSAMQPVEAAFKQKIQIHAH
jgi:phage pi2 protein 07